MESSNGKCVLSSQDTSMPSKSDKPSVHPNGDNNDVICAPFGCSVVMKETNGQVGMSSVTLRHREKDLQTSGSENADCISITPSNKGKQQRNANGDAISLRSSRRSNEEAQSDATLSPGKCKPYMKQTEVVDCGGSVDLHTSTPDHPGISNLKQSAVSNQPSVSTEIKGDYEKHPISRKRGRPRKLRVVVADTVDQTLTRSDSVKPLGPIVIGLTHNGKLIDSRPESSGRLLKVKKAIKDERLAASADHESVASEPQKVGEVTNLKRKRGRPPKVLFGLGSPMINKAVPESVKNKRQNVDVKGSTERLSPPDEVENPVAVVELLPISYSIPSNCVGIVSDQFKRLSNIRRLSLGKRSTARRQARKHSKIPIAAAVEPANTFIMRGKKLKSIKQAELLTRGNFADAADSSNGRAVEEDPDNGVGRDVTVSAVTSSNAGDDDKPLSAWLEGAQSPPSATDASQFVETGVMRGETETLSCGQPKENAQEEKDETSAGNSSRDNDATKRPNETLVQSTAIVPRESQELPFVKNSLVWGVIESMEVLKRIPQKPHFLPLYNCKEECREGLAIGNMVTFTSLAEKISRARFDEPKSLYEGYLEALVDLEELGFNVAPVRELLHKLISVKSRYEQAQNMYKEIESQIMERKREKSKIDDEIAELEKMIMELKEKQAFAVSKKERKDAEIALLQLSVDAVNGGLASAEEEFEKLTASFW